ncbi:dephospho-CoA kinase [Paracoccus sp. Z330]|uniref:Dephospho-CoA kinase n=1 Tax=Paracoccus onchidii TaxID=3017813 RepID=A0ABT4ZGD2_9RHOB|nr:dephospho-CoA kinase [Paracoccus onchidii]MDB6178157.1 dephospho-CoA kinase [Paracoccus onchidii]
MSFVLGLTGSIGMGKSTTAQMFRDRGYPVWDADRVVHDLYEPGGAAVDAVSALFPAALIENAIDRDVLKSCIAKDPTALTRLEQVVHPMVSENRQGFLGANRDALLVVLDIPLLFEGNMEPDLDGVAVVSTNRETQRARVLARPGMTESTFEMILSRQVPDAEKRARANWVIPTDTLDAANAAVDAICQEIEEKCVR